MSDDVWSAQDTTPEAIDSALRRLLRDRHANQPMLAPARVLNLIVVVDREWKGEIANRLERVGRFHASRTILCTVEEGRTTLDAVAVMRYDPSPGGTLCVVHEQVQLDLGPEHLKRLDTIIDPIKVPELTTLLWSPHEHEDAIASLLPMCDVVLRDSDEDEDAGDGLAKSADLLDDVYVVDLAWLRTTPWRERLAASFDPPNRRAVLRYVHELSIRHNPSSKASASLLAGWLASRLHAQLGMFEGAEGSGRHGTARLDGEQNEVRIHFDPHEQEAPGLGGVTVAWGKDSSLSLDRSAGGLRALQQGRGQQREWRILGASRGEAGILGEGVRQALLRDPTYGPALSAAREIAA